MTELDPEQLHIAADVAAIIGPEYTARIRREERLRRGPCWGCHEPLDPAAEPLSVSIAVGEGTVGDLRELRITHTRCAPSSVYHSGQADEPDSDPVDAITTLWPPTMINPRPVLLLSARGEGVVVAESGDAVDINTGIMIRAGWTLAAPIGRPVETVPERTGALWRITAGDGRYDYGRLTLEGPFKDGEVDLIADVELTAPMLWTAAVTASGHADVYFGPFDIHAWQDGLSYPDIKRAIRSGNTAAARVPVTTEPPA